MKRLPLVNTVLIIAVLVYVGITSSKEKEAYININEVYNDFEMKIELENKLIAVQTKRKQVMDSLELEIQLASNRLSTITELSIEESQKFELMQRNYLTQRDQFEAENDRVTQEFKNQIFTRLNEYAKEYGEKEGYDYLFGTTGQGSIMYAKPEHDITKAVTKYINEKYKGNN